MLILSGIMPFFGGKYLCNFAFLIPINFAKVCQVCNIFGTFWQFETEIRRILVGTF